jgi:hypothetical protein
MYHLVTLEQTPRFDVTFSFFKKTVRFRSELENYFSKTTSEILKEISHETLANPLTPPCDILATFFLTTTTPRVSRYI